MVTSSPGQIGTWIAFLAQRDGRPFHGIAGCDGGTTPLPHARPPNGIPWSNFRKTLQVSRSIAAAGHWSVSEPAAAVGVGEGATPWLAVRGVTAASISFRPTPTTVTASA